MHPLGQRASPAARIGTMRPPAPCIPDRTVRNTPTSYHAQRFFPPCRTEPPGSRPNEPDDAGAAEGHASCGINPFFSISCESWPRDSVSHGSAAEPEHRSAGGASNFGLHRPCAGTEPRNAPASAAGLDFRNAGDAGPDTSSKDRSDINPGYTRLGDKVMTAPIPPSANGESAAGRPCSPCKPRRQNLPQSMQSHSFRSDSKWRIPR